MKKNKNIIQFPNIFRFIPEQRLIKKLIKSKITFNVVAGFSIVVSIIFVLGIIIYLLSLYKNVNSMFYLVKSRQIMQTKINFWKSITDKYEGYKDAYFQQAILEYQLGNLRSAKKANDKALLLDPNFTDAKNLNEVLENN